MDFEALKTLLETHPNYATATDQELVDWCNDEVIERVRPTVNSDEMYELIDGTEFNNLTADQRDEVWNMLLLFASSGIPTSAGTRARTRFVSIFGAGSTTITNVVAAITYQISRVAASDAGAEEVAIGDIQHVRTSL